MNDDIQNTVEEIKGFRESVFEILDEIKKVCAGISLMKLNNDDKWKILKDGYYEKIRAAFLLESEKIKAGNKYHS